MFAKVLKSEKFSFYVFQLANFLAKILTVVLFNKFNLSNTILNTYESLFLLQNTFSFALLNAFFSSFLQSKFSKIPVKNAFATLLLLLFFIDLLVFFPLLRIAPEAAFGFLFFTTFVNISLFLPYYFFLLRKKQALLIFSGFFFFGFTGSLVLPLAAGFSLSQAFTLGGGVFATASVLFFFYEKIFPVFNKKMFFKHLALLLPLALTYFISGGANYIDGWIVKIFGSPEDFLRFRYGAREFPFTLLLANVISASIVVQLSETKDPKYVRKNQTRFMHFAFPLTILMLFLSEPVFGFLYKEEIASAYKIFNIYLLLIIPRALFPQSVLLAFGKNKRLLLASVPEFILHILLGIAGFQLFGIKGVSYAVVIAYFFEKLLLFVWIKKDLHKNYKEFIALRSYLFYVLLLLIAFLSSEFLIRIVPLNT